jgi:multidrug efflux pump subunit AcrA (membrane-fusion protein)
MSELLTIPTPRRSDLVLRPLGNDGRYVAKNPQTGAYFNLGEPEFFLLSRLDGKQTDGDICRAFTDHFQDPLSKADLADFLDMARGRGLLASGDQQAAGAAADAQPSKAASKPKSRQSILYCRKSVFDPDRALNWLTPKLGFVFTPLFFAVSIPAIVTAGLMSWANRFELVSTFSQSLRWEIFVLAWITIVLATLCHEFAHGITCKRYGGEVHELGILFMFFMPCFYVNVSDAWLIPEKSKRLWVTLAGAYCDLCLWATASFVWRLTMQDTLVNYLAWIVMSICGVRILFNFNPLMKLDGYYLLSDWLEAPNLRRRAYDRWMGHVRWLLWGAPRPQAEARGTALLIFGMVCWIFSVVFLDVTFMGLCRWLGARYGWIGVAFAMFVFSLVLRRLFRGISMGEIKKMLTKRHLRTTAWVLGLAAVAIGVCVGRIDNRTGGAFQVRPGTRAEVRAAVAGFLREARYDEGDRVSAGELIVRMEVPDLSSLIAQKNAELRESRAKVRRLEAGTRPEEIGEQKLRVERAVQWRDLAGQDLARAKQALAEELSRIDQQVAQYRTELDYATQALSQSEMLYNKGVLAGQQLLAEKKKFQVVESQWQQAQTLKRVRQAEGTLEKEAELARRTKELADQKAALSLLEAGSRPEEIEAERAHLARLDEEASYLAGMQEKVLVQAPVAGLVTTARLKEKIGQYFEKGALICVIEDTSGIEAEISLPEQEVNGIREGQTVELKARALPFHTFHAKGNRIAPSALLADGQQQSKVSIYCRLENPNPDLRSGMTGFGRISRGEQSIATVMSDRALKYVRTEFWW